MSQITPAMIRKLRARLLDRAERVRIKRNGEVHCYGQMPNSNTVGWYFAGFENNLVEQFDYFADGK